MYKVFINNKRLILANSKENLDYENASVVCIKNPKTVNAVIRNHLLKSSTSDLIVLSADDKTLIKTFESNYKIRIAAGGFVWNKNNDLLMIYREDRWDLPKGHLDKGESLEGCAIREVREETGITDLEIDSKTGISRHIYEFNDQMILKITHWYQMHSYTNESLKPQIEEGITKVVWVPENSISSYFDHSWESLRELYYDYIKT